MLCFRTYLCATSVAVLAACNGARPTPSAEGAGAAAPSPTHALTGAAVADAGVVLPRATGGSSPDAGPDGASAGLGQPIDAGVREQTHTDDLCHVSPTGWWATSASIDPAVSGADFAASLNPLIGVREAHPVTLAMFVDDAAHWQLLTTASATNGIGQQYFPFDHASSPSPATRTATSVASTDRVAAAWLRVVDGAGATVWIALADVDARATIDDVYCAHLSAGVVTATVAHAASSVAITLADHSSTTLGGLLGPERGGGWPFRMTFEAEKVQITLK